MPETRDQILDLAENAIRQRGYHAVSFRDIADELGIKSASIHYHFRRKEDLGVAVVERYAAVFHEHLGPAKALPWPKALARICQLYQDALTTTDMQCLCGMLASESLGLPDEVGSSVSVFFKHNIDWLKSSLPDQIADKEQHALHIQAELQGALTLAISLRDHDILKQIIKKLKAEA